MMDIKNIADLKMRIFDLEFKKKDHEIYLQQKVADVKDRLAGPLKLYQRFTGMFLGKTKFTPIDNNKTERGADWVNLLARVGVPFLLNKLLFNKAGFIAKTLISLVSQSAVTSVNKNSVAHLVDVVTGFVKSKTKKKKPFDYGIPPDSEAY